MILTAESGSISIRDPELGETYTPKLNIKIKTALSGQRWGYALPTDTTVIEWNLDHLSREKVVELFGFLHATRGQDVTVKIMKRPKTDPETYEIWLGKILTNPINTAQTGRFQSNITLSFEGKKTGEADA